MPDSIGDRPHYILIVEPTAQTADALGHCPEVDVTVYEAFAKIEPTGGSESAGAGDQTQAGATYRIELPWPGPITERMVVVTEQGRRLEILSVVNVGMADITAVLTCGESR